MNIKTTKVQTNSRGCFICGLDNDHGVHAHFYELEDNSVATKFMFNPHLQSYPGRTHGGIISAMLDEVVGRALWIEEPGAYAVTTTMTIRFRKPVPYDKELKARGYIVKNSSRMYVGRGEVYDMENNLLAEFEGNYMKLPPNVASNSDVDVDKEMCYNLPMKEEYFDFPPKRIDL